MAPRQASVRVEDRDELTPEESLAFAEGQTRKYLDMSVDEFKRRAQEGTLPEHPVVPHLVLITGARATGYC